MECLYFKNYYITLYTIKKIDEKSINKIFNTGPMPLPYWKFFPLFNILTSPSCHMHNYLDTAISYQEQCLKPTFLSCMRILPKGQRDETIDVTATAMPPARQPKQFFFPSLQQLNASCVLTSCHLPSYFLP